MTGQFRTYRESVMAVLEALAGAQAVRADTGGAQEQLEELAGRLDALARAVGLLDPPDSVEASEIEDWCTVAVWYLTDAANAVWAASRSKLRMGEFKFAPLGYEEWEPSALMAARAVGVTLHAVNYYAGHSPLPGVVEPDDLFEEHKGCYPWGRVALPVIWRTKKMG
jgi:hypothetical protein